MPSRPKVYLFDRYPEYRAQWDYEKNIGIDPEKLSYGSNKYVWWSCANKTHPSWATTPNQRRDGRGCPYCSGRLAIVGHTDIGTTHPEACKYLVDEADSQYPKSSMKVVEWRCDAGHVYEMIIGHRIKIGNGCCPFCSGRRVLTGYNDLESRYPEIAKTLVDADPKVTYMGGSKKLRWKCDLDHIYTATPQKRVNRGQGCPICANKQVLIGYNDLAHTEPELAKELVNPEQGKTVTRSSGKRLDWVCSEGHTWSVAPHQRTGRAARGCEKCSTAQTSKVEARIRDMLSAKWTVSSGYAHRVPVAWRSQRSMTVDIQILSFDKTIVEYDGAYYHKDRYTPDLEKTALLLDAGYTVIRVRETTKQHPLGLLDLHSANLLQISAKDASLNLGPIVEEIVAWLEEKNEQVPTSD